MKKLSIIGAFVLLSTTSFMNSGCTCKDTVALCDLAIKAFTTSTDVVVGQAFDVISDIANDEESGECTSTEIANSTFNLLEIFLNDGNGGWTKVGDKADIAQPGISPGDLKTLLQSLTLNLAGDYRFDYYDDHVGDVTERNENNNYASERGTADTKTALRGTNNFASIYLTVHPLPDGTTQIKDKPIVEFQ